jgi:phosphopentomutase
MRVFLVVLDSVGIGAAPDAAAYGDSGANTLGHVAAAVGGLDVPTLQRLGLGNIPAAIGGMPNLAGVPPAATPLAAYGALRELSRGKDTTTGHWEMAGILLETGFTVFPDVQPVFPAELTASFVRRTGRGILGNRAASGTQIIAELGEEQAASGKWIVYTSADSVFQIAAHEAVIPLDEIYQGCRTARELCNPYQIGRVIARPFIGAPGHYRRTENRRDFSYPLPEPCILDRAAAGGVTTVTVGKLDDIFPIPIARVCHVENNAAAQNWLLRLAAEPPDGPLFVFANLIDFDMLYGHRRDPAGYAAALAQTDRFFDRFIHLLGKDDVLLITADHGNDPTFTGTDHTREYVPLLAYRPAAAPPGQNIGVRHGFYDIAQSVASVFGLPPMPRGLSFLPPV